MASLGKSYIESEIPKGNGGGDFSPIPDGWYDVTITESVVKATKAGTGDYLSYRCDVIGPTHQGRVVFGMITLRNPNPKAEDIGNQQMAELCRAIGAARLDDSDQIIGKRFRIREFRWPSFLRVYRWREQDHGSKKQLTHREAPPQVQSGRRDTRQKPRIKPRPKGSPKMPATDAALQ